MEKITLGFNLGFNTSAALVSNVKGVLAAISQERLNGEKNTKEIPIKAMLKCFEIANVKQIYSISYCHYQELTWDEILKYMPKEYESDAKLAVDENKTFNGLLHQILSENGIKIETHLFFRTEHHMSHLFSCFGFYKKPHEFYGVTCDGFGDGVSCRIIKTIGDEQMIVAERRMKDSIALIYQFVTGALGFKMHQHEGKITGLAAYGKPSLIKEFENALFFEGTTIVDVEKLKQIEGDDVAVYENSKNKIIDFDKFVRLKRTVFDLISDLLKNNKREDIAATLQFLSEKSTTDWITENINEKGLPCFLAGGLFANVKINQRIKETNLFKQIFVSPPMGDEGTSIGSAIISLDNISFEISKHSSAYFGSHMLDDELVKHLDLLKNISIDYLKDEELIAEIANELTNKKIVCLCRGAMEFGPRALCHRSILYDCTEKSTNDWLNAQLSRTEFMPFAPVCLVEDARDLFKNFDNDLTSAFMTMTFDCSDEFIKEYPAASHIDDTARPQVLFKDDDIFMRNILKKYKDVSGKKVLINTSFNLHNHPIIESVEDAIESWLKSNTDILVINNTMFKRSV